MGEDIGEKLDYNLGPFDGASVIRNGHAQVPALVRAQLAEPWREAILELYGRYEGHLGRVLEELLQRGASLSYPALTAFCRRHGIGTAPPLPAGRYEFNAGAEMQHDTGPRRVKIGDVLTRSRPPPRCYVIPG